MDSHALNPFGSDLKASQKLPGLGMSNMSFLTEDLIQFVSGTTFSQGDGTKINSKQFSEVGSQTDTITHGFCLVSNGFSFSNMAETNRVSLQFDRHIQRQKNKVY